MIVQDPLEATIDRAGGARPAGQFADVQIASLHTFAVTEPAGPFPTVLLRAATSDRGVASA